MPCLSCSTFSLKLLKIWWRYLYIYPREYDMAQKSAFDTRYYSTSVFIKVILLVGLWILPKWKLTPLHNSLMVKTKSGRMGFDSEWMLGDCFGNLHCKSSESGWGKSERYWIILIISDRSATITVAHCAKKEAICRLLILSWLYFVLPLFSLVIYSWS